MSLERLVPPGSTITSDPDEAELRALYAYPAPRRGRTVVRANMVASVDGGAWGTDHRSGTINDDADARVFAVLRSLADVVLVGAGTARAERYGPLAVTGALSRHRDAALVTAIVTESGTVPRSIAQPRDGDDRPVLVVTGTRGARSARAAVGEGRTIVVGPATEPPLGAAPGPHLGPATDPPPPATTASGTPRAERDRRTGLDLAEALAALADRGLGRVLCEGGPTLLGALLAADLVDELCLTTTPTLVGAGPGRIVGGRQGAASAVRPLRLDHLLHAGGTTLARWTIPTRQVSGLGVGAPQ